MFWLYCVILCLVCLFILGGALWTLCRTAVDSLWYVMCYMICIMYVHYINCYCILCIYVYTHICINVILILIIFMFMSTNGTDARKDAADFCFDAEKMLRTLDSTLKQKETEPPLETQSVAPNINDMSCPNAGK